MHSMPASAACEKIGWAAFQSMDNQILLYGIGNEGFKLNRKKRYVGHLVAGYSVNKQTNKKKKKKKKKKLKYFFV